MFLNATKCDIYIGTGAGKKLLHEIDNAQHSIKILSPFLSPFLVKKLISLHHRKINIQLITSDTIEDFYGDRKKNIYELIQQQVHTNKKAQEIRKRWRKIRSLLRILMVLFIGLGVWFKYIHQEEWIVGILISVFLLFLMSKSSQSKIANIRVFSYTYKQLFPFKVVLSPNKYDTKGMYLHGKIYIIDNKIAYVGSLNFTGSGTKKNYETRIRFSNQEAVQKIVDEFDELFINNNLPEISIESWGKQLYKEPIN